MLSFQSPVHRVRPHEDLQHHPARHRAARLSPSRDQDGHSDHQEVLQGESLGEAGLPEGRHTRHQEEQVRALQSRKIKAHWSFGHFSHSYKATQSAGFVIQS